MNRSGIRTGQLNLARSAGFTMLELMITVVIAGIIAAIAYPMYTNYSRKAHRSAAMTALLGIASREERYYSTNNVYATNLTTLGYSAATINAPSTGTAYYQVSFSSASSTQFTLQAVPVGGQVQDTQCGTFTLNSLNQKNASGTDGGASCWQQ